MAEAGKSFLSQDWTLVPQSQANDAKSELLNWAPVSRSYERVMVAAEVQAVLLARHGRLCGQSCGYQDDTELFDDSWREAAGALTPGMPCLLHGSARLAAYLGEEPGGTGEPRAWLRLLGGERVQCRLSELLPLPTEPVNVGDWALVLGAPRLMGRPGLCLEALGDGRETFLVAFPQSAEAGAAAASNAGTVLSYFLARCRRRFRRCIVET